MTGINLGVGVSVGLMMTKRDLGTGAEVRARDVAVKAGVSTEAVTAVDVGGATGGLGATPGSPHPVSASISTTNRRAILDSNLDNVSKELPPQRRVGWFLGQVTMFHGVHHRGGSANVPRHSPLAHFR